VIEELNELSADQRPADVIETARGTLVIGAT